VLAASDEYARAELVTIPLSEQSVAGDWYVIIETGAGGTLVEAGVQNNTLARPIELALPPLPDLVVTDVSAPAVGTPGTTVSLSWSVSNAGTQPAMGTWVEAVFLSDDAMVGGDVLVGRFTRSGPIAPGDPPAVRTENVMLSGVLPAGLLRFVVVVDQDHELIELAESNNAAVAATGTKVPGALSLVLSKDRVAEDAGVAAVRATLTRSGQTTYPLVATLTSSDPLELSVPATVTIPAGRASVSFDVGVLTDGVVDGDKAVAIEAQALDMVVAVAGLVVEDVDVPALALDLVLNEVTEGQTWTATVTRDTVTADPLTVLFGASVLGVLALPDEAVIPAGEAAVTFELAAVDDNLVKLTRSVTVEARSPGFTSGADRLDVLDNDAPTLGLILDRTTMSEGAGQAAVLATVTRGPVGTTAMTVLLATNDPSELAVPASVVIPAGAASVSVWLAAVDDALVDGPQMVTLTATPTCYLGYPLATGQVEAQIEVTDDDGPALSLSIEHDLVSEGLSAATSVTVTRNTATTDPLEVQLFSSDPGELAVPLTVVIPAGWASYTFPVDSVEDGEPDGNQTVTLTASAAGFAPGSDMVVVSDVDLPDLVVETLTAPPASVLTEDYFDVTYRIANHGLSEAIAENAGGEFPGSWQERVFLSDDPFAGGDVLVGTYEFVGTLPNTPGSNSYARTIPVRAPKASGPYWIVVTTDLGGTLTEGIETNNTRVVGPIQVEAAYTASVSTATETAPAGTTVLFEGTATKSTGGPAPFVMVNLHLEVRGTRRIISALTNSLGQFTATFTPLPGEAGDYTVGAAHPGEASAPVQDEFTLLGMRAEPPSAALGLVEGESAQGVFTIRNLCAVPLQGLTWEVLNAPASLDVTVELPAGNELGGLGTLPVAYEVTALDASVPSTTLTVRLTTLEGVSIDVPLSVRVTALAPELVAAPGELVASMQPGTQRLVEFIVTNQGGAPTGPIDVVLPSVPWLTLATAGALPSLAPGESAAVVLALDPPADLPLTAYEGNLVLRAAGDAVSVPFTFRAVSEAKGDLLITAIDELYYFTAEAPTLSGAAVILLDAISGDQMAQGTTDAQGQLLVPALPEGYYTLEVRAEKHANLRKTVFVTGGQVTPILAFLSQQTVKYIWTVKETEIPDVTRVAIETVFETNVPTPVVTVDPPLLDLAPLSAPGQSMQVDMTLENHGLIAAEGVRFWFGAHPLYRITPLVEDVGLLPAKSSLTIPVLVERLAEDAADADLDTDYDSDGDGASVPCNIPGGVDYSYPCGPENVKKNTGVTVTNLDVAGCVIRPTGGGAGGGGGGTIHPAEFPGVDFTPIDFSGEVECDCEEKTLGEVDLSGWFKPAVTAAETAINAAIASTLVSIGLKVEAKGQLILCCKPDESTGLEFRASAGVTGTLAAGPGFNIGVSLSEPMPDGGSVSFSGSAFLGAQATLTAGLSGSVTSGCGMDNPSARLNGSVRVAFDVGAKGKVEAKKESGVLPTEVTFVDVVGGLFGGASVTVSYSTETGLDVSFNSEGIYLEVYASAFGYTVSPFDDPSTPEIERRKYLVKPSSSADADCGEDGDAPLAQWTSLVSMTPEEVQELLAGEMAKLGLLWNPPPAIDTPDASDGDGGCGCGCGCGGDAAGDPGVCAHVRLRIDQEAVMTRTAFDASLELFNNDATGPIEDVLVAVTVIDVANNDVTDRFGVHAPRLENIAGVDGTGTVGPESSGKASWLIVPTDEAAPAAPTAYGVGGTLSYTQGGRRVIVPLEPVWITVMPDAALDLKYFHQRDVRSDDPWTDEIEPSEPFALAVMVQNHGAGAARNLSITSAQPEIVENEKGLLIDFEIIATQVAGENLTPSLTADFGNVAPGATEIATWYMTSTVQGQFIEYAATFEHLDALGDPRLSLIKSVEIHELIHVVRADGDGLPDFLANDVPDFTQVPGADEWFHDLPDTLHLSDGRVEPVALVTEAAADGPATPTDLVVQLTVDMAEGWDYVRMSDPGGSQFLLVQVQRSDGTLLPVDNFWQTDRTFVELGRRPIEEDNLHLFDHCAVDGLCTYTLTYVPRDQAGPVVASVQGPGAEPQLDPVDSVLVTFNEPVNLATFDTADLVLSRDGGPNLLGAGVSISHVSGNTYRVAGLAAMTGPAGVYELTVDASGVTDALGNPGSGAGSTQWLALGDVPVVVEVTGVPLAPTALPIDFVEVTFSHPIQPGTLSVEDLSLTRDGGPNLLGAGLTFTQTGTSTFRVGPLAGLTDAEGQYTLTINATGVENLEGDAGVGTAVRTWTVDTTGPTVGSITGAAAVVKTLVASLLVTFSEPIDAASFDPGAATLTRDGGPDLLGAGVSLVRVSGTTYRLTPLAALTSLDGAYQLVLSPGAVCDLAGNPSANSASIGWTKDSVAPEPATNLAIAPDTGAFSTDGRTNTLSVTLAGTLAEPGLTVALYDVTTGKALGGANVDGTAFSAPIAFTAAGTHRLRARATDAAGNWADSFFDVFVDLVNPLVLEVDAPLQFTGTAAARLTVRFSEPVAVEAMLADGSILSAISLVHLGQGPVALVADQFAYESATNTLIVSLESFDGGLPGGNYELAIDGARVADVAGNLLRGGAGGRVTFGFPALAWQGNVQADGEDIQVDEYSVPALADWNDDGLVDLLVGESTGVQGRVRIYLNTGTAASPVFEEAGWALLQSEQPLTVPAGGCLGAFPRVVDWNADGKNDLLVGRSDGTIQVFTNVGTAAVPRFASAGMVEVGSPGAKSPLDVGSRATLDVVDWDNDGRFDLVVGGLDGRIRVLLDKALTGTPDFRTADVLASGAGDLLVPSGRASVAVVDLDGDGRKDLVVGNTDGQVLFYANSGTDAQPVFGEVQALLADGLAIDLDGTPRSRPFVGDFNDDGRLDLVVGAADGLVRLYTGQSTSAVGGQFNNNGGPAGTPYVYTTPIAPAARILVEPKTGLLTTEAGGTDTFTVVLNSRPSAPVVIALSSSNPAEGLPSPSVLTFTPDDWNVPQTVTVTGQDDAAADGGVGYTILTAPATSEDPNYAGLDGPDVAVTNFDDDAPPTVTAVGVRGSAWTPAFAHVDGYTIPSGADQWAALPWAGIDQIEITFSEDVVVAQNDLVLRGAIVDQYAWAGFRYDAQTWTATWELAAPVQIDCLFLFLSDNVRDRFGDALDGEWRSGTSTGPSGDGNPGGQFVFHLNVVPGDANRDGRIDDLDASILAGQWGSAGSDLAADFDGNGLVDALDGAVIAAHWLDHLPGPGDANLDGVVNRLDAAHLAAHWLATDAVWSDGDFNRDGRVDDLDASILAANWRYVPGEAASPPRSAANDSATLPPAAVDALMSAE